MKQTQRVSFILILLLVLGATVRYYLSAKATGTPSILPFLILGIAGLLYYGVFLILEIDASGIRFRFTPFLNHAYSWPDIQEVKIIKLKPFGFIGLGLRYSFKHKIWCYAVQGSDAMCLTLKNGKHMYIGIDDPAAVSQYIATLHKKL